MRDYKNLFEKLLKGGDETLKKLIFAFIIGVILMNFGNLMFDKKDDQKNIVEKNNIVKKDEQDSTYKTTIEKKLSEALENVEGAGKVEVIMNLDDSNLMGKESTVKGVLIVSAGAHRLKVKEELQKITQILLDLPVNKIYVISKGGN